MAALNIRCQKVPGEDAWEGKVKSFICRIWYNGDVEFDGKHHIFTMGWSIRDSKTSKMIATCASTMFSDDSIEAVKITKAACEEALQKYI